MIGLVEKRITAEAEILDRSFTLTAHRTNYFLPYTYNSSPNKDAFRLSNPNESIDSAEAQFQVSFKIPIAQNILDTRNDVFFAFTSGRGGRLIIMTPLRHFEKPITNRNYSSDTMAVQNWGL